MTCRDSSNVDSSFFLTQNVLPAQVQGVRARGSPLHSWWLIHKARPWRGCRTVRIAEDSILQNCCGTAYLQEI